MDAQVDACRIESHLTRELEADAYDELVERIRPLYLWFSPDSTPDDIYDRLHRHPESRIDLLIGEDGGLTAFSVYHTEQVGCHSVMFRGGTIVKERSRGYYRRILEHGVRNGKPDFLVAYTQNPRVYESLRRFSSAHSMYPCVHGSAPPSEVRAIALHFCPKECRDDFDLRTLILSGIYEKLRKDDTFKTCRDPDVRAMFDRQLQENDGFLVVVPVAGV